MEVATKKRSRKETKRIRREERKKTLPTAVLSGTRTAPQKARLVADAVRGKNVNEALNILKFGIKKDVAEDIAKLISSAVANIANKSDANVEVDELLVKEIKVSEGTVMKRFRPRAKGSASPILKRSCHISVKLSN